MTWSLMLESRDKWLLSKILEDNFFDREPVSDAHSFKRAEDNDEAFLSQLLHCTRPCLLIIVRVRESQSVLVPS